MTNNVLEHTKELVRIASVSGNETEILDFIHRWATEAGLSDIHATNRFVCGVVRAKKPARRALILCGHIDTVASGEVSEWSHIPWEPVEADGRLSGLGVGDMKAGVAIQMACMESAAAHPHEYDLWIAAVAAEEVDGAGAAAFTDYFESKTDYQEVNCIIAEPTNASRVEVGHRGNRFVTFSFSGEAGHASQEQQYAISSLPPLVAMLNDLEVIREHLRRKYCSEVMGVPSFTPTRVGSGKNSSLNKTSDLSTLSVDIRTTPEMDEDFERWIDNLAATYSCTWRYDASFVSSASCSRSAPILACAKQVTGIATSSISSGATDQAYFQQKGIDTIIYGPGEFERAHTCNESISIQAIKEVYRQYTAIMQAY